MLPAMTITRAADEADFALRQRAEAVGSALRGALAELVQAVESGGARDQRDYQSVLHIGQSAVSRLLAAVRSGDPLTTLVSVPGGSVLGQMLQGAARSRLDRDLVNRASAAVRAFEDFVDREFGDRASLDIVLGEWVLESRAQLESRQRAMAYKTMAALRGVQADLVLSAGILVPSGTDAGLHDGLAIEALLGCRRLKPSGVLRLNFQSMASDLAQHRPQSPAGQDADGLAGLLLHPHSTVRPEQISSVRQQRLIQTTVHGLPLSRQQGPGQDIVHARVYHAAHRARRGDGGPTSGMAAHAEPPTACCVIDALLHDDVWPGVVPEPLCYDTVVRGIAHPDDPARAGDRIELHEKPQFLGHGPEAFRLPEFSGYPALIREVCAARDWDPARLRGWRLKVPYPIYGAQLALAFRLPD
jgi:hypothetical protein